MPKRVNNGGNWLWSAGGKHPVARDFFISGDDSPLSRAFFDWAERGAQLLTAKNGKEQKAHSFRFWSKGSATGQLVCGLVRSSCDQLGRPYPLMLMGTGILPDWENNWELLPVACEKTWENLEYIAVKRYSNLASFHAELKLLKPPRHDWTTMLTAVTPDQEINIDIPKRVDENGSIVRITSASRDDIATHIMAHHCRLKKVDGVPPRAVFIGGDSEHTSIFAFSAPLQADNYLQMWSL